MSMTCGAARRFAAAWLLLSLTWAEARRGWQAAVAELGAPIARAPGKARGLPKLDTPGPKPHASWEHFAGNRGTRSALTLGQAHLLPNADIPGPKTLSAWEGFAGGDGESSAAIPGRAWELPKLDIQGPRPHISWDGLAGDDDVSLPHDIVDSAQPEDIVDLGAAVPMHVSRFAEDIVDAFPGVPLGVLGDGAAEPKRLEEGADITDGMVSDMWAHPPDVDAAQPWPKRRRAEELIQARPDVIDVLERITRLGPWVPARADDELKHSWLQAALVAKVPINFEVRWRLAEGVSVPKPPPGARSPGDLEQSWPCVAIRWDAADDLQFNLSSRLKGDPFRAAKQLLWERLAHHRGRAGLLSRFTLDNVLEPRRIMWEMVSQGSGTRLLEVLLAANTSAGVDARLEGVDLDALATVWHAHISNVPTDCDMILRAVPSQPVSDALAGGGRHPQPRPTSTPSPLPRDLEVMRKTGGWMTDDVADEAKPLWLHTLKGFCLEMGFRQIGFGVERFKSYAHYAVPCTSLAWVSPRLIEGPLSLETAPRKGMGELWLELFAQDIRSRLKHERGRERRLKCRFTLDDPLLPRRIKWEILDARWPVLELALRRMGGDTVPRVAA